VERSSLEERVARIEGILEQMDKRLNHLEGEIRDLRAYFESEFKGLRGEIGDLRRDLNNRFLWMLGVQITMWVTILLAILFR
jgi:predicted nuclease with TOPRIM domain